MILAFYRVLIGFQTLNDCVQNIYPYVHLEFNPIFEHLFVQISEELVDVTLSCSGGSIRAHKIILSACSQYFKHIFKVHILKDLFRENFYSTIRFYTLRTSKIRRKNSK